VAAWLDGIRHAADLMQHSVGRLVSLAVPADFPLKRDYVNLSVLIERACHFYRSRADAAHVHIACAVVGHVPLVWADRVALAVIADNLLANAVSVSRAHGTIRVQIMPGPGHVLCSIRDAGPGLATDTTSSSGGSPEPAGPHDHALGLVIARDFARRLDGDLWSESDATRGTCYTFRVPAIE